MSCGSLFEIMLSCNLCSFQTLFLNNLANLFTNVSSVIATKYTILSNLLHTTSITSFFATNGNLVIKSTINMFIASLISHLLLVFLLVLLYSSLFSGTYICLHISLYSSLLLAINNFLSLTLLPSISLHVWLLANHDVTGLFLFLISHISVHKPFLFSILTCLLSIPHLLSILLFPPLFLP